jgi:hypothetical protein
VSRRVAARRPSLVERRLVVRTTIEPEVVSDLLDLVQRVCGRATPDGRDVLSVPIPKGVDEDDAYRELRALLQTWEIRHPGIRAEIVDGRTSGARPDQRPVRRRVRYAVKQ